MLELVVDPLHIFIFFSILGPIIRPRILWNTSFIEDLILILFAKMVQITIYKCSGNNKCFVVHFTCPFLSFYALFFGQELKRI